MIPAGQRLVDEARDVLRRLGFDGPRSNDRSAMTLLALLDLKPGTPWSAATDGLYGVTPLMTWIAEHLGKRYAPNSRETIRRQTLHQFVDAGLVLHNPDDPARPVNSGKNVYRVEPEALRLLRCLGTPEWDTRLAAYVARRPGLRAAYAAAREQQMIPVTLPDGAQIRLTPGGQNELIRQMIEIFCPRWTPGGRVLYVGDAGKATPVYDVRGLAALGKAGLDKHSKLPDLVVHMEDRQWLVLMEAADSHGPVDSKRHRELKKVFENTTAGLVFVSCFPTRAEMRRYLSEIAWETDAWCADAPSHLIHFNGERFLGPYTVPGGP